MAGIVAAMPGGATIIATPLLGRLGDRIGTQKILIGGFLISIACFIPSAFVGNSPGSALSSGSPTPPCSPKYRPS